MDNIYIIDDDDAVRDSLVMLFKSEDLNAIYFASATSFLEGIDEASEGVIILDLHMPTIPGLAVMEELDKRGLSLPVICITGHGDVSTAVRVLKMGAYDFLEKPFNSAELVKKTRQCLKEYHNKKQLRDYSLYANKMLSRLTSREYEVMQGMLAGLRNKQIAYNMSISIRTVELHRSHVLEKLEARSLSEVVKIAIAADYENIRIQ